MTRCVRCEEEGLTSYKFRKKWTSKWSLFSSYTKTTVVEKSFPTCWNCMNDFHSWKKIHSILKVFLVLVIIYFLIGIWFRILWGSIVLLIILALFLYAIVITLKRNPNNYIKFKKWSRSFYVKPEGSSGWISYPEWRLKMSLIPHKPKIQIPQKAWNRFNSGMYCTFSKSYKNALEKFDDALKIHPEFPQALSEKGKILIKLQRYEEALFSLDEALKYDPDLKSAKKNKFLVIKLLKKKKF